MSGKMQVVIPTSGRLELLERTLQSLEQCSKPSDFQGVTVIENGVRQEAAALVQDFGRWMPTRYQYVPAANKSEALNAALVNLDDDCLSVFFDDDIRLDERVLIAYSQAAKHSKSAFFGGPFQVDYDVAPPQWLMKYLPGSATGWRPRNPIHIGGFTGFNWAARVRHIRRVGGFNPQFGPGSPLRLPGQETEMQSRLSAMGLQSVYVPDAMVWHFVPESRCSPEWALRRAEGNAMYLGFQNALQRQRTSGVPLRMRVNAAICAIRRRLLAPVVAGAEVRYKFQFKDVWARSLVNGFRLAQQQSRVGKETRNSLHRSPVRQRKAA